MQEHLHNNEDLPLRKPITYVKSWKFILFCVATSICNEWTTITRQWRHRCAWKLITTLREHWTLLTAKTMIKLRPNKSMKTRLVTMHSCSREDDDESLPWNSKITTNSVAHSVNHTHVSNNTVSPAEPRRAIKTGHIPTTPIQQQNMSGRQT